MKKLIIILGFIFVIGIVIGTFIFFNKSETTDVIDEVNGYVLLSNASDYEKELFGLLKNDLEKDEKAEIIFKLFVANFYSLDLAYSKNDVRGVQFVYESFQDDFVKKAKDTVYFNVKNNFFEKRMQTLPIVKEVEVVESEESTFTIGDEEYDAYFFKGNVNYVIDDGFDTEVSSYIIINENKLEVVSLDTYLSGM